MKTSTDPAGDQLSADERARAEVAKQIRVKIEQLVEDIEREEGRGGESRRDYSVRVETRETVERSLQGVKIVDRRVDAERGVTCSVARLDKAAMAARIRADLEDALAETSSYLAAASQSERSANAAEALRAYTLGLLSLGPASVQAGLMRDLGYAPPLVPARAQVWERWMAALKAIRIQVVDGDGQKGRPGHPLASPLRVRAEMNGTVPAANLPLKVLRAPEGLQMQREAQTDRSGEVSLRVTRVPPGRRPIQEIAVGLDWEALLRDGVEPSQDAVWAEWDTRAVVLVYRVPVPSDYRVGVAVYDGASGLAAAGSPLQTAVLDGLQRAGFRTVDIFGLSGETRRRFASRPSWAEASQSLSGQVDILLLGDFRVSEPVQAPYDLLFCHARVTVEGTALKGGGTVLSLELRAKGGGLDRERAAGKALEGLVKSVRSQVGERLADALP